MTNQLVTTNAEAKSLITAFTKAQAEMATVVKGSVNPAFKSKYADLASVLDAVLPALNKNGLALLQCPSFDGDMVTVTTTIAHIDGSTLFSSLSMRPTKQDPQGVGSAITYARRYGLLAMCGVAPEDDDGNAASEKVTNPATGRQVNPMSANQARKDGRGERAAALAHEIDDLQGVAEAMAWQREHAEEVATWPPSWSLRLTEQFEQHLGDLRGLGAQANGADPDTGELDDALDGDNVPETFPGDLPRTPQ